MYDNCVCFPAAQRPRLARLLSVPGPPESMLVRHGRTALMAVPGRYSVSYLLIDGDRVVIVDCGSTADLTPIRRALAWLGLDAESVRYVAPSHLHFDHVLGLDALANALGVEVALGEVCEEHVRGIRELNWPRRWRLLRAIPTWPMQGMPVFTRLDWGRMDFGFPWSRNRFSAPLGVRLMHSESLPELPSWTVLATPGHSDDALCFFQPEAGWLVCGDTLRNFLGGEWNPLLTNREQYSETRKLLCSLAVRHVFPGHGPAFKVATGLGEIESRPWYVP